MRGSGRGRGTWRPSAVRSALLAGLALALSNCCHVSADAARPFPAKTATVDSTTGGTAGAPGLGADAAAVKVSGPPVYLRIGRPYYSGGRGMLRGVNGQQYMRERSG